ncbi:hypothetical protein BU23DRAFT_551825 [Bimuria novae-zelandiae CBS 107.79]|uniref:Uncharacterized protein n=1 Tax=Bimuria novae-zelandiae CBS 107.79 TaxID=1447943 RepID=A0A6A5VI71_9PLEO|nr:hypothetical protein BU23DRAFT_551825 [Bimuria novae-zelandiae CBS 107.79]
MQKVYLAGFGALLFAIVPYIYVAPAWSLHFPRTTPPTQSPPNVLSCPWRPATAIILPLCTYDVLLVIFNGILLLSNSAILGQPIATHKTDCKLGLLMSAEAG